MQAQTDQVYEKNVIILGESQNGKSTLIKTLYEMASLTPPASLEVGEGGEAVTLIPTVYELTIPLGAWELLNHKDKPVSHSNWFQDQDIFDELSDDRKLKLKKLGDLSTVKLKIIDTPGLKGTDQNDENNMLAVLRCLLELKEIHSVVLVNKGSNYGPNFQETLRYYLEMIGQPVPLDMIHTKFTADDLSSALEKKQTYPEKISRVIEFDKVFNSLLESYNTTVQHWLVDCLPKKNKAFRELLKIETLNRWLGSLSTKNPYPTKRMMYTKTPKMVALDWQLITYNQALAHGHNSGVTEKDKEMRECSDQLQKLSNKLADQESALSRSKTLLEKIDAETLVIIKTRSVDEVWKLFSGIEVKVEETLIHPIRNVAKSPGTAYTYFKDEHIENNYYSIICYSRITRGTYASLSWYTYIRDVEADRIASEKQLIEDLEKNITHTKGEIQQLTQKNDKYTKQIEHLKDNIAMYTKADSLIQNPKLDSEFFLQIWGFYEKLFTIQEKNERAKLFAEITKQYYIQNS